MRSFDLRPRQAIFPLSICVLVGSGCDPTPSGTRDDSPDLVDTADTDAAGDESLWCERAQDFDDGVLDGEITPSEQVGPLSGHMVMRATSDDGLEWRADGVCRIGQFSVPFPLRLPNGDVVVYGVNAQNGSGTENLGCKVSRDDGMTFHDAPCVVDGTGTRNVDPTAIMLSDGRIEVCYLAVPMDLGDPGMDFDSHKVKCASSTTDDGEQYGMALHDETDIFAYDGLVDPDIAWLPAESAYYLYATSLQGIGLPAHEFLANSTDNADYQLVGELNIVGYSTSQPIPFQDADATYYRMYSFQHGEGDRIYSFRSDDGMTDWTLESGVRLQAPDGYMVTDMQVLPRLERDTDPYVAFYKLSVPFQ